MTSYTVTGSTTNNTFGGELLQVEVLTGATLAGTPATATSTTAYNVSISTTQDGCYVIGGICNDSDGGAFTASAGCTIISQFSNTSTTTSYAAYRTTNATSGTPGATTVGSSTTFDTNYGVVALEVIPNGTIAFDASSPAVATSLTATTLTTASFTPPGNSLLVAVMTITGNLSAAVCVGTVSSTPALSNWTERVKLSSTVGGTNSYIGVWTATVPTGSAPFYPANQVLRARLHSQGQQVRDPGLIYANSVYIPVT